MAIQLSSSADGPEHLVRCAISGCRRLGLRSEVGESCREYRCPEHIHDYVQSDSGHPERVALLDDITSKERCLICSNRDTGIAKVSIPIAETFNAEIDALKALLNATNERREFGSLLLDRFTRLISQLDKLGSYLERQLWAGMFARDLDRYFDLQVTVHEYNRKRIVRVDFASTLLRIAIFTDGHKHHDPPGAQAEDARHNAALRNMGWIVKRYWYEEIKDHINERIEEIHEFVCQRIAEMQECGLPIAGDPRPDRNV